MSLPSVSVVIPAHGRPELLLETVASCTAQDYAGPVEIIVIDDGSPQDLGGALRPRFPDVKCVRIQNAGSATARQTGTDLAGGDYIAYIDDDDLWEPNKLTLQIALMQAHPEIDLSLTDMLKFSAVETSTVINSKDHHEQFDCPHRKLCDDPPAYIWEPRAYTPALLMGAPFPPQTTVTRKAFVARAGGWDKRIRDNGQDVEFGVRASWAGRVAFLALPLTRQRRHHGSNISHDVTRAYSIVLRNITNAARDYPGELRDFMRAGLGGYYARVGWMMMREKKYAKAAWHYHRALEYKQRTPAIIARYAFSKLRALGAEEPPPSPRT